MSSNSDEIYRQKAVLEPVAPVTLWLYPDLKVIAGSRQRTALAEATRKAGRHWISYALRLTVLIVALVGIWAIQADRPDLRRALNNVFLLSMLTWFLFTYIRTRIELRSGRMPSEAQPTPNDLLERTRER